MLQDIPRAGTGVATIGDYDLLEVIAHGGMGVVYKARQRSLGRVVALKLLLGGVHAHADFKSRFTKEAQLAARLSHPNIVPVFETGHHDGQPFFSMEYVAGSDLTLVIKRQRFTSKQAASFLIPIVEAVDYAHRQGIIHRDLKPSNILVGQDGRAHITDFGLAVQTDADSSLTLSGATIGTPGYLPPEQVTAKRGQAGPHSDIYSLGAVL